MARGSELMGAGADGGSVEWVARRLELCSRYWMGGRLRSRAPRSDPRANPIRVPPIQPSVPFFQERTPNLTAWEKALKQDAVQSGSCKLSPLTLGLPSPTCQTSWSEE